MERNILYHQHGTGYIPWKFKKDHEITPPQVILTPPVLNNGIDDLQMFVDRIFPKASTEFREHDHYLFEYHGLLDKTGLSLALSLPVFKKYDRLTSNLRTPIQYPLHTSQNMSIKAFNERNGNVPNLSGLSNAYEDAVKLIAAYRKLKVRRPDFSDKYIEPNADSLEEWLNGQPPAVKKIVSEDPDVYGKRFNLYEFIIKTSPKIDLEVGAQFRYKAPQTIAFQSKTVNALFCPLLKDFMDRVEYQLHPNILLYNSMSPQGFANCMTRYFPPRKYKSFPIFLEIDFNKYDKSMKLPLLISECLLMIEEGVPPRFVRIWYIAHLITYLVDLYNKMFAIVECQRKSGDAGTWRLNTMILLLLLNFVFRLWYLLAVDSCFIVLSGDDSVVFLKEPIRNLQERLRLLQTKYNMEAKLFNFSIPYFCSKFLLIVDDHWIFVPDTVKMVVKLGRNDLTDFDHVECYRISFDDNLYYYKRKAYWSYISLAINNRYKICGDHDNVYQALLWLASSSSRFATLYSEPRDYVRGHINVKPNLEI